MNQVARPEVDRTEDRRVELEREQAHVAMLYGWLDRTRERALVRLERALHQGEGDTPQAWLDRDALVARHAGRLAQLSAVEHGLCLGRLERRDQTSVSIGRIGLADDEHEQLLIDWRAPAAEPFYRATPVAPGEIVRRRHLQMQGRTVTGFNDDVFDLEALGDAERGRLNGEAALLASLDARRTGRMGDIVATIQAEQDRVIRAELAGVLVIQGGPGTGKTAVALHRAAYLLYTHRDRLAGRGVLVVGPSPTFLRYIEQVLPSLGETDVLLATVDELYPGVSVGAAEPVEAVTLKGDARMAGVLAAAVADRRRVPEAALEIALDDASVRLDPETCAHAHALASAGRAPHNQARTVFVREVVSALARQVGERIEDELRAVDELVDDSVFGDDEQLADGPVVDEAQLAGIRAELRAAPAVRAAIDQLWPLLTPEQLVADLLASPERLAVAAPDLSDAERSLLLRPRESGWSAADVPLLDEAAELLGEDPEAARRQEARRAEQERRELEEAREVLAGTTIGDAARYAPDTSRLDPAVIAERWRERRAEETLAERARGDRTWIFGHLVVDEAQELSAMAWRVLMRRCPGRSMTVVGDLAQVGAPGGASSWAHMLDPGASGRWRTEELTVNYRTPAEIMALAADVLAGVAPHLTPPTSVRTTGVAPRHLRVGPDELPARLAEVVAAELEAVDDGRLAVIVPATGSEALARRLVAALPQLAVAHGPEALDAPVAVLTVTEAKGLEFDAVVVAEPATILAESPNGANNLYVALTRATQRLAVVHTTPLPPALARLES